MYHLIFLDMANAYTVVETLPTLTHTYLESSDDYAYLSSAAYNLNLELHKVYLEQFVEVNGMTVDEMLAAGY
jgi:hypothetical protein